MTHDPIGPGAAAEAAEAERAEHAERDQRDPGRRRVLLACERLDLAGGVERFICHLANHLAAQGWQVGVASAVALTEPLHFPVLPSVAVLSGGVPASGPVRRASGPLRRLALAARQWQVGRDLARLSAAFQPDVLVLNGLTAACSSLLVAPGLARRTVCCDHNHFEARSRPWQWARRGLYARLPAVVSLTEADRPRYARINPRTTVIPNASALWAESPTPPDPFTALAVGRHVAQKGFDLLLRAWVEVRAAQPLARLRIVGHGDLAPVLKAQALALGIDGSVDWRPPTRDIAAEYRRAAVFVLSSRYEGMPLALLEAQALGVPAVAFDCPTGPREVLGEDTGVLVPPQDTAALARGILSVINDPARRERMALAAIARSRQCFGQDQHLSRWTTLLDRVADGVNAASSRTAPASFTPRP